MLEYTSSNITQLQKQYDMLVTSLQYCSENDKKDIYVELDKLEENILNATNEVYEEAYNGLLNEETFLLDDERKRLSKIINLVVKRKEYLKLRKENHKNISNKVIKQPNVIGEERIVEFEKRLSIINKYIRNVGLKEKLVKELSVLEEKEKVCLIRLKHNDKMNAELESKMISVLNKAFNSLDLFSLLERNEEIELAFRELSFAKDKAKENVDFAIKNNDEQTIIECNKMLDSVTGEYNRYFEKKMLLELITIYDNPVIEYDDLLSKREKMNDILRDLSGSEFYNLVCLEMEKQYNTIKIQEQDVKTYRSLSLEVSEKKRIIDEIDEENNSEEFKNILDELIKNEKSRKERILQEQRRKEYEERQRKLIEENKRQEEIRKKQRLIEEERKKEIERRTKELLEAKSKTTILKKEDEEPKKEESIKEEFVEHKIPSNSIESKMKTVFVPKEEVFTNYDVLEDKQKTEVKNVQEEIKSQPKTNFIEEKEEVIDVDENKKSIFDSIFNEMKEKIEIEKKSSQEEKKEQIKEVKNDFSIPVIKNSNLVATKVKEEEVIEEDLSKFKEIKEEKDSNDEFEVKDVIFPDMPL